MTLVLLVLLAPDAWGRQIIDQAHLVHVEVRVSAQEQNRLSIEGRRIAHIVPSRKHALTVLKDETMGALYFALAEEGETKQTLTLFVNDDMGVSYRLILVPKPVAGEEILLRPPHEPHSKDLLLQHQAATYQRRIKDLTLVMANPSLQGSEHTERVDRVVALWREAELVFLSRLDMPDMVGEHYRLTNISPSTMRMVEQELYRPGVLAISVEHQALGSGETTNIFLVRRRGIDE